MPSLVVPLGCRVLVVVTVSVGWLLRSIQMHNRQNHAHVCHWSPLQPQDEKARKEMARLTCTTNRPNARSASIQAAGPAESFLASSRGGWLPPCTESCKSRHQMYLLPLSVMGRWRMKSMLTLSNAPLTRIGWRGSLKETRFDGIFEDSAGVRGHVLRAQNSHVINAGCGSHSRRQWKAS